MEDKELVIKIKDFSNELYRECIFKPLLYKYKDSKINNAIRFTPDGNMINYINITNNGESIFDFFIKCKTDKETLKIYELVNSNSLLSLVDYKNKIYGK